MLRCMTLTHISPPPPRARPRPLRHCHGVPRLQRGPLHLRAVESVAVSNESAPTAGSSTRRFLLKLVNAVLALVGICALAFSIYMAVTYKRSHVPPPAPTTTVYPWYVLCPHCAVSAAAFFHTCVGVDS